MDAGTKEEVILVVKCLGVLLGGCFTIIMIDMIIDYKTAVDSAQIMSTTIVDTAKIIFQR